MKKSIVLSVFAVGSLSLFSFTTPQITKDYNINKATCKLVKEIGTFTKYEDHETTADKGTWCYRNETYSLTNNKEMVSNLESVLNK